MRDVRIATWAAIILIFGAVVPAYAQPARPPEETSTATIRDGKAAVNGVLYHYLLARGHGAPSCSCTAGARPLTCGAS
jgi:hypothetical protein